LTYCRGAAKIILLMSDRTGSIRAVPNPIRVSNPKGCGAATLEWTSHGASEVEVRVGSPEGPLFARSGPSGSGATDRWIEDGMTFYLQDISEGRPLTAEHTLASTVVRLDRPKTRFRGSPPDAPPAPPVGKVDFGDLRRVTPIAYGWGRERGRAVDRHYIESFYSAYRTDIRGRVVSISEDSYVQRFGGAQVAQSDVLDIDQENGRATIIADLCNAPQIPDRSFDCFVCPQTLQLIYDVKAAIGTIHRVLKPGGVALVTVSAISQTYDDQWGDFWCWNFAPYGIRKLFAEVFPDHAIEIRPYGNTLSAIAFLMGLGQQEIDRHELEHHEPGFEIVIGVRAVKGEIP
jgi:SAM-dependent methyltransferase